MNEYLRRNVLENHFIIGLVVIVMGVFLFEIKSILVSLFIAYILMSALSPAVNFLVNHKFRRGLAVLLVYLSFVIALISVVIPLGSFVVLQFKLLFDNFPEYANRAALSFGFSTDALNIKSILSQESEFLGKNALTVTSKFFGGIFSLVTVLVVSLYLLLEKNRFQQGIEGLFSQDKRERVKELLLAVENLLGAWVRGQLTLCFIIGLASFVGLSILQIPYALPLAVLAGILEAVPTIGPIISAIPAVIVASTIAPASAVAVMILYVLIQQLENNLIVPKVMQKVVGLSPVVVILAIGAGGQLMGVIGAILAVPLVLVVTTLVPKIRG